MLLVVSQPKRNRVRPASTLGRVKFPTLPSCLCDDTGSWAQLGRQVAVACEQMAAHLLIEPSATMAVQIFEADRRAGRPAASFRLSRAADVERSDEDCCAFTAIYCTPT